MVTGAMLRQYCGGKGRGWRGGRAYDTRDLPRKGNHFSNWHCWYSKLRPRRPTGRRAIRTCLIVLFTPAMVGLLSDAYLSAGFGDRDTLADVDLGFPEFADDLFRSEAFSSHLSPFMSF